MQTFVGKPFGWFPLGRGEESSVDEYKWGNYVRRSRAEVEGFGRSLESASWVPKRCWVSRRPPGRIRNGIPLEVQ